jgi:hypothetical protein
MALNAFSCRKHTLSDPSRQCVGRQTDAVADAEQVSVDCEKISSAKSSKPKQIKGGS